LKQSITSTVEENSVMVGTNVGYAPNVEFGTGAKGDPSVAHTTKKQWTYYSGGHFYTTSGQVPQPFLVPALKNSKEKITGVFKEVYRGD
jgi:phage gpG-like protein